MSTRAARLLQLLDELRRRRKPVTGAQLAELLGVSLRSLYRDIETLRGQGADIVGDPGVGYQLRPGFLLPPMMFAEEELEAMVLGTRWVASHADPELAASARSAMDRILGILPEPLRLQARDAQAAGDRLYWPIYNLDLKNPNAPEEETLDPDLLLEKYKKLLGEIEETDNQLKSERAAALAHHLVGEDA